MSVQEINFGGRKFECHTVAIGKDKEPKTDLSINPTVFSKSTYPAYCTAAMLEMVTTDRTPMAATKRVAPDRLCASFAQTSEYVR